MLSIPPSQLPASETDVRAALARYQAALEAHRTTEGLAAPWPEFEILRTINEAGGEFIVVDVPAVAALTPEEKFVIELASKRAAALKALDDARLAAAGQDPNAPQAVKDYVSASALAPALKP